MRPRSLLLALLPVLLLTCLAVSLLAQGERSAEPSSPAASADASHLRGELRALARQLEELPAMLREATLAAPAESRSPIPSRSEELSPEDDSPLLARLDELGRKLDGLHGEKSLPPTLASRLEPRKPQQVQALAQLWNQTEEERSRAHQFLGYAELLARYGRPDTMYVSEGSLVWVYTDAEGQLGFTFFDGFVIGVWGGLRSGEEET